MSKSSLKISVSLYDSTKFENAYVHRKRFTQILNAFSLPHQTLRYIFMKNKFLITQLY